MNVTLLASWLRSYTRRMTDHSELLRGNPGGFLSPLMLAGYAAWAAVTYELLSQLGPTDFLEPRFVTGMAALAAFLLLFMSRAVLVGRNVPRAEATVVLGEALLALLVCWAFAPYYDELAPALLVIVAAQMALAFSPPVLAAVLLGTNAALVALLWETWSEHGLMHLLVAYAGLQTFAVFASRYALEAAEARDEALRMNAELVATRHLLEAGAQVEERLRLSRELHDIAGHKLTALKMQLALQSRQAPATDAAALQACERLADGLLSDIRGVVGALRQHDGVDLQGALRALDPGLPSPGIRFDLDGDLRVADMRRAQALLRCAQEGLANALRHSAAAEIRVRLAREEDGVVLSIEDDGRGRSRSVREGNGLRGLQERLSEVGGRIELRDRVPTGLTLRVVLPDPVVPC